MLRSSGNKCLRMSHKADEGSLFPLDKSFIFLHKPVLFIRHKNVKLSSCFLSIVVGYYSLPFLCRRRMRVERSSSQGFSFLSGSVFLSPLVISWHVISCCFSIRIWLLYVILCFFFSQLNFLGRLIHPGLLNLRCPPPMVTPICLIMSIGLLQHPFLSLSLWDHTCEVLSFGDEMKGKRRGYATIMLFFSIFAIFSHSRAVGNSTFLNRTWRRRIFHLLVLERFALFFFFVMVMPSLSSNAQFSSREMNFLYLWNRTWSLRKRNKRNSMLRSGSKGQSRTKMMEVLHLMNHRMSSSHILFFFALSYSELISSYVALFVFFRDSFFLLLCPGLVMELQFLLFMNTLILFYSVPVAISTVMNHLLAKEI